MTFASVYLSANMTVLLTGKLLVVDSGFGRAARGLVLSYFA
jgi:hypothetical protein